MRYSFIKKVSSFVLIVTLMLASNSTALAAGSTGMSEDSVTVSIEKMTLAGGFVLEPTQVRLHNGESLEGVLNRVAGNQLIWQGDQLYAVVGAESSGDSVPIAISSMSNNANNEVAPTQASLKEVGLKSPGQLGEQDYSSMSAWLCSINNQLIGSDMAGYIPTAGDVIRVQFSLWGNGADLGQTLGGNVPAIYAADKDRLLEALAEVRNSPYFSQFMSDSAYGEVYNQAMEMAENLQVSQAAVDAAADQLIASQPVPVQAITLSAGNLEMNVAQTDGLSVAVFPENATLDRVIVWQSSNPAVAEVDDNGVITGLGRVWQRFRPQHKAETSTRPVW